LNGKKATWGNSERHTVETFRYPETEVKIHGKAHTIEEKGGKGIEGKKVDANKNINFSNKQQTDNTSSRPKRDLQTPDSANIHRKKKRARIREGKATANKKHKNLKIPPRNPVEKKKKAPSRKGPPKGNGLLVSARSRPRTEKTKLRKRKGSIGSQER